MDLLGIVRPDLTIMDAVVGIDPFMVPFTRLSHEQGLGIGDISRIDIPGENLKDMQIEDFKLPSGTASFFGARGSDALPSQHAGGKIRGVSFI